MVANLIIILITIVFSAFFSGMEIAFLSSNKLRLELDKKREGLTAGIISIFTNNPSQYISTMLVGNNITLVIYGIEIAKLLNPFIERYISSQTSVVLLIQTLLSTLIILITGEFLPKSIFKQYPNQFLTMFAPLVMVFYIALYPITRFATWLSRSFIRIFMRIKIDPNTDHMIFGKVDLDNLVEQSLPAPDDNGRHDQELKIFQNALDFSEVRVRDCMIPRTDIEAIDITESVQALRKMFVETKYSRLPVYKENVDNIVGYINSKDLFRNPSSIRAKMKPIDYFPETQFANKLLAHFIKEHRSIAVVVDEFGGTAGLITIEDIMEEIFGEIDDEHDRNEFVEKQIGDNEYMLSARLEIAYLNEKYQLNIPESDDYETLAGFILNRYQSIPKTNQLIEIEEFSIKIVRMEETRIDLVQLKQLGK